MKHYFVDPVFAKLDHGATDKRNITMPEYLTPQDIANRAELEYLLKRKSELEIQVARSSTRFDPEDRYKGDQYRARADEVYEPHGRMPPIQQEGESSELYRRRLAEGIKIYHPDLNQLADGELYTLPQKVFDTFEQEIYKAASTPESRKVGIPPGEIKEIVRRDSETGRMIHEFISSDNRTFIHQLGDQNPKRVVAGIYGLKQLGGPPEAIQPPERAGRQPLLNGFPR
jgi:hypothetical protein